MVKGKFALHYNVFGYGSLMDPSEVAKTLGINIANAKSMMMPAFLRNWKRSYSKFSTKWGGNALNIEPCANKVVNGILITKLTPKQLGAIIKREEGYSIKRVVVETEKGKELPAYTFVAKPVRGNISKKYVQLVERAALAYGTEFYQLFKKSF